ncbi:MAG: 2-amino-4-hydroxy-6-hydroxymethyldihydropteridine diphosphokinase [Micrococcales bacterium]
MKNAVHSVLAIGGNLGDRQANIKAAVDKIGELKKVKVRAVSPLVESFAVTAAGVDESKPNYINAVVKVDTALKPKKLLKKLRKVEAELGRVRLERWGSRTMDIDIITYGEEIISKKTLTVPHPRAYQRAFVLVPWNLIDDKAVLPGHGKVSELVKPVAHDVWVVS